MLRKKVFLYVSFVKSVQFVCAIILVNLFFYGSKKNSLSLICYHKYIKNPYYLQVYRLLLGRYFKHSL